MSVRDLRFRYPTGDDVLVDVNVDIPAGRIADPTEIAGTAVFLASDLASFYYGEVLSPNGGALMR